MNPNRRAMLAPPLCLLLASCVAGSAAGSPGAPRPVGNGVSAGAREGVDYVVYDRNGRTTSLAAIRAAAARAEVVLVGEEHDDVVGHAFEAELYSTLLEQLGAGRPTSGRLVVLSLEMFERDVQYVLDEYRAGLISEDHFLRSSRPWDGYEASYRPLVEAAIVGGTPIVAANAPRRYVNRVTREGPSSLDALSVQARSYLPPLPYPGPSERYRAQWDSLMSAAMAGMPAPAPDTTAGPNHSVAANAIYAQALWDAAMGHAITSALLEHPGALVVHFAGSFHVERGTGIPERIEDYRPGTRVVSVVMTQVVDVADWSADEHAGLADYVVLTREDPEGD